MKVINQYLEETLQSSNNPSQLYKYLTTIAYGYIDLRGKKITPSDKIWEDDDYFIKNYRSQSVQQTIKSKIGICGDKVEVSKYILEKIGLHNNVYYLELTKNHDGHSFISYVSNNKHYWIESSWKSPHNGLHKFNSEKDLLKHVAKEFVKESYGGGSGFINLITSPRPIGKNIYELMKRGQQGKKVFTI